MNLTPCITGGGTGGWRIFMGYGGLAGNFLPEI